MQIRKIYQIIMNEHIYWVSSHILESDGNDQADEAARVCPKHNWLESVETTKQIKQPSLP